MAEQPVQSGRFSQFTESLREQRASGIAASFQMSAIALGNLIILIVVGGIISEGFVHTDAFRAPELPLGFFFGELGIILAASILAFIEYGNWSVLTGGNGTGPSHDQDKETSESWWVKSRDVVLVIAIYGLFITNLYALVNLVNNTGGGVDSPFAPLLTAPAIYGPFIARRKRIAIPLIVVTVSVLIILLDVTATTTKCKTTHICRLSTTIRPEKWAFAAVAVLLISVAGGITAGQRTRLNPSRGNQMEEAADRHESSEPAEPGA